MCACVCVCANTINKNNSIIIVKWRLTSKKCFANWVCARVCVRRIIIIIGLSIKHKTLNTAIVILCTCFVLYKRLQSIWFEWTIYFEWWCCPLNTIFCTKSNTVIPPNWSSTPGMNYIWFQSNWKIVFQSDSTNFMEYASRVLCDHQMGEESWHIATLLEDVAVPLKSYCWLQNVLKKVNYAML